MGLATVIGSVMHEKVLKFTSFKGFLEGPILSSNFYKWLLRGWQSWKSKVTKDYQKSHQWMTNFNSWFFITVGFEKAYEVFERKVTEI